MTRSFVRRFALPLMFVSIVASAGWLYAATVLTKAQASVTITGFFQNVTSPTNSTFAPRYEFLNSFADGSGVNQAEFLVYKETTVAGSSTNVIDLRGGLTDNFGNASLACTRLKGLWLENRSTTSGDILRLESDGTNGAIGFIKAKGDGIQVLPGGLQLWWGPSAAGAATTAATADLLNVVNEGSNVVTYRYGLVCTDT